MNRGYYLKFNITRGQGTKTDYKLAFSSIHDSLIVASNLDNIGIIDRKVSGGETAMSEEIFTLGGCRKI